ncbi:hypothetical protein [Curtobacterium sp. VKM Ac-2887]|uniref:hypothetical protein n=1 Tax=Curtobacterium sp. VKM Ac-2887 TaxID=2783819 RepID=UPI00188AB2CF|nr:hypothetical protein [Curtobacterium sp. VKM Ac-2887]MBF4585716.1 hypothetical protein [Curtobacterium sp. VKM Ac-2887]
MSVVAHPPESPEDGLRAIKRRRAAIALHEAALRLASGRSGDCTIDRITETANLSSRTFFNYFATKEDAILGLTDLTTPSEDDAILFTGAALSGAESIVAGARWVHRTIASAFLVHANAEQLARIVEQEPTLRRRVLTLHHDAESACRTALRAVAHEDERLVVETHLTVAAAALRQALVGTFEGAPSRPIVDPTTFAACEESVRAFARAVPMPTTEERTTRVEA